MPEELGERTEQPTSRRLSQARRRGQLAKSADFSSSVELIGALIILLTLGTGLVNGLAAVLRTLLGGRGVAVLSLNSVGELMRWSMWRGVWLVAPMVLLIVAVGVLAQFLQVGWLLTLEPLKPNIGRLNPLGGVKKLLGRRSAVKGLVSVLKLAVVLVVVVLVLRAQVRQIAGLPALGAVAALAMSGKIVLKLITWMLVLMLIIGLLDLMYQRWQRTKDLKMTKQEVKDERKSMEGDMEVKARRLRMARQMLLQQLRRDVPTADVVVTNPTHFAVAIKYDQDKMAAPKVVAKGADYMAFRIRELAVASGVPIVEKPALARALYAEVAVGRHIAPEFFQAVAEILAYVYRLKGKAA
jgi:flagellar biosynthetic protein FlhB